MPLLSCASRSPTEVRPFPLMYAPRTVGRARRSAAAVSTRIRMHIRGPITALPSICVQNSGHRVSGLDRPCFMMSESCNIIHHLPISSSSAIPAVSTGVKVTFSSTLRTYNQQCPSEFPGLHAPAAIAAASCGYVNSVLTTGNAFPSTPLVAVLVVRKQCDGGGTKVVRDPRRGLCPPGMVYPVSVFCSDPILKGERLIDQHLSPDAL
ncbi:hypothetical protein B0H17DRAFT_1082808, partial [Mycena rosella]